MKYIAILTAGVAAAIGVAANARPVEAHGYADAARRAASATAAYPLPAALVLGGLVLAIVVRCRSSAPPPVSEPENPVVARAKARATWTQLLSDQMALESKYQDLPRQAAEASAELDAAEAALVEAWAVLKVKQEERDEAAAVLDAVREEQAMAEAELTAVAAELEKLAGVV